MLGNVLLTIQYDGTRYHGWQVQPNAVTVQQTLQDALEQVSGSRPNVTGCSRTDTGVHARRFYCTLQRPERLPPPQLIRALNATLPHDIAVLDCREVADDFHPRYSAHGKRYVYHIWNSAVRSAFYKDHSLHIQSRLDEHVLQETAALFMGTHDFSAFCSAGSSVEDKCRTVTRSEVCRNGDMITFTVEADGFLYNMVRIFVGTLLDVHAGRLTNDSVKRALETGDRSAAGATAPPQGLFLDEVFYQTEDAYER